jgi:predicted transcriptional regulator
MLSPDESRRALRLVTGAAASSAVLLLGESSGLPSTRRADLLDAVPALVSYYADGSSALAADFYEFQREQAPVSRSFTAEPIVNDRSAKLRAAVTWATAPLFLEDEQGARDRLSEVVSFEVGRPFPDTIIGNGRRDPENVGWMRIARPGACKFCTMLTERGAVYRKETANFAAHGKNANGSGGDCRCTAAPVFDGQVGEEASVIQYVANNRPSSARERARVRKYLTENYPDAPG